jgi:hypothetical protein
MNYLAPMTISLVTGNGSKSMLIKQKLKIVNTPERVNNIMTAILNNEDEVDRKKEHFWVIGTNTQLRIEYFARKIYKNKLKFKLIYTDIDIKYNKKG